MGLIIFVIVIVLILLGCIWVLGFFKDEDDDNYWQYKGRHSNNYKTERREFIKKFGYEDED